MRRLWTGCVLFKADLNIKCAPYFNISLSIYCNTVDSETSISGDHKDSSNVLIRLNQNSITGTYFLFSIYICFLLDEWLVLNVCLKQTVGRCGCRNFITVYFLVDLIRLYHNMLTVFRDANLIHC